CEIPRAVALPGSYHAIIGQRPKIVGRIAKLGAEYIDVVLAQRRRRPAWSWPVRVNHYRRTGQSMCAGDGMFDAGEELARLKLLRSQNFVNRRHLSHRYAPGLSLVKDLISGFRTEPFIELSQELL